LKVPLLFLRGTELLLSFFSFFTSPRFRNGSIHTLIQGPFRFFFSWSRVFCVLVFFFFRFPPVLSAKPGRLPPPPPTFHILCLLRGVYPALHISDVEPPIKPHKHNAGRLCPFPPNFCSLPPKRRSFPPPPLGTGFPSVSFPSQLT